MYVDETVATVPGCCSFPYFICSYM